MHTINVGNCPRFISIINKYLDSLLHYVITAQMNICFNLLINVFAITVEVCWRVKYDVNVARCLTV